MLPSAPPRAVGRFLSPTGRRICGCVPWLPVGRETAAGDGATTESKGRFFVTTELGVQIFDPAGRLAGIIAKPSPQSKVVSVEFAGKSFDTLFIAAGDKIYARQLKVTGHFR